MFSFSHVLFLWLSVNLFLSLLLQYHYSNNQPERWHLLALTISAQTCKHTHIYTITRTYTHLVSIWAGCPLHAKLMRLAMGHITNISSNLPSILSQIHTHIKRHAQRFTLWDTESNGRRHTDRHEWLHKNRNSTTCTKLYPQKHFCSEMQNREQDEKERRHKWRSLKWKENQWSHMFVICIAMYLFFNIAEYKFWGFFSLSWILNTSLIVSLQKNTCKQ